MHRIRTVIAERIRLGRKQHGWSQEQLAEKAGLHRTYIGAVERRERNLGIDNAERIANALRVSVGNLMMDI